MFRVPASLHSHWGVVLPSVFAPPGEFARFPLLARAPQSLIVAMIIPPCVIPRRVLANDNAAYCGQRAYMLGPLESLAYVGELGNDHRC